MAKVILEESTHTYINQENPDFKYISTTTLLGKYEPEFDADFHANRIAERDGVSAESILAKWAHINWLATEYGTKVHKIMERHLLNRHKLYIPRDDFEKMILMEFKKLGMLNDHRIIQPEYIVTHPLAENFGIAGSVDVIEDENDKSFNIFDFKTNRDLTFRTDYGKWMYFPVDHHSQNNYTMDCLQISAYAYFYELETGKKVNSLGVLYWDRGDDIEGTVGIWKFLYLPYMKTDIKNIINHYKASL